MWRLIVLIPLAVAGCGSNGMTDRMDNFFDPGGHPARSTPSTPYRDPGYRSGYASPRSEYPSRDVDPDGYSGRPSPPYRLSP